MPARGAAIILGASLVALLFARAPLPIVAFFVPITIVLAIVADFATFGVLVATLQLERRRSILMLSFGYVAAALLMMAFLFITPFAAGQTPILSVGLQTASAIYTFWHVVFAVYCIGYVMLWRLDDTPIRRIRFSMLLAGIVTAMIVAACLGIAIGAERALPTMVVGTNLSGYRSSGVGYVTLAFCLTAFFAVAYFGRPSRIDRALALSLLAVSIDVFFILWSGERFTTAWYASRFLYTAGSTFVLYSAVRELIAANRRRALASGGIFSHAERLAALWEIAARAGDDDRALDEILAVGAKAIRPGFAFSGHLGHVEGETSVVDRRYVAESHVQRAQVQVGDRIPVGRFLYAETIAAGETMAWNDLSLDAAASRHPALLAGGWRSAIMTPFVVGSKQYVLAFGSDEPISPAFSREDRAYIDVLASYFSARLSARDHLESIRFDADHDTLTGLPNRRAFRELGGQLLGEGGPFTLAIADLDHFREINDTLGHDTGDAILVAIAHALRAFVREGEYLGRIGGDNFAILMRGPASLEVADARVREWAAVFARAYAIVGHADIESVRIDASFGVALAPTDAATFEELLSRADAAIGAAKRAGGGRHAFFSREIAAAQIQSLALRSELLRAVADDQLLLYYQPTIALATLQSAGAEALVRWQHPTRGLVMPSEFIPFAEENGLISEIGRWVLRRAIRDTALLSAGPLRCFLNLSSSQLDDHSFLHELHDRLAEDPTIVARLGVEVTETAAMRDVERSLRTLQSLRDLGLPIALDDFGTGYSSLAYLKQMPIDVIKIDRSFISGLPHDPHDLAIVETLLSIAQQLGFATLAEGVETAEQLAWLTERGCTMAQGYLIARPMPYAEFVAWRAAYRPSVESKT